MIRLLVTILFSLFAFLMHAQRSPVYTIQGELKALSVSDGVAVKSDVSLNAQKVYAEFREGVEKDALKIVQQGSSLEIRFHEHKSKRKKKRKKEQNAPLVTLYLSQQNIVDYTVGSLSDLVIEGKVKTGALKVNV